MTTLHPQDLLFAVNRLPKPLRQMLKEIEPPLFVAGGYIRSIITGEEINDIDVFACSESSAKALANELFANWPNRPPAAKIHKTANAFTLIGLGLTIQFIFRWSFQTPQQCVESFDFTIASAAFWWAAPPLTHTPGIDKGQWLSTCDDNYYPDLAARRLVYRFPVREEEAGGSMLRVLKFYQRGYRIPLDSLGGVISRLVKDITESGIEAIAPSDDEHWREKALTKIITSRLREVDPLIDPDHIAHLPSVNEEAIAKELTCACEQGGHKQCMGYVLKAAGIKVPCSCPCHNNLHNGPESIACAGSHCQLCTDPDCGCICHKPKP